MSFCSFAKSHVVSQASCYTCQSDNYNLKIDSKELARTDFSIRIDRYLIWPKAVGLAAVGLGPVLHPSQPKNASKLRLGLNLWVFFIVP